jgi:hypothetical protein
MVCYAEPVVVNHGLYGEPVIVNHGMLCIMVCYAEPVVGIAQHDPLPLAQLNKP